MLKNPGQAGIYSTTANNLGQNGLRYFLENRANVTKEVMDYVRRRNFQPHELRDHEFIKGEIRMVIRKFLKEQAKKELTGIRKRITEIEKELLKYTHITLHPGVHNRFTDYESLCEKIRSLRDWKRRRVVALRIDPPKVRIKVGKTVKFKAIAKYSGGTEFWLFSQSSG